MDPHFLAIPLPLSIQLKLASFCYGLPQVHWVEQGNFHLTLCYLGQLSNHSLENIKECLNPLFFLRFFLILQGAGHFHSKSQRGTIWIGIANNPQLLSLKKEIENQLKGLSLPPKERVFFPHVTLGYYERLNPQKLSDYLADLANYQSDPIEISSCLLLRSLQTPKHTIYEPIEHYLASSPNLGED